MHRVGRFVRGASPLVPHLLRSSNKVHILGNINKTIVRWQTTSTSPHKSENNEKIDTTENKPSDQIVVDTPNEKKEDSTKTEVVTTEPVTDANQEVPERELTPREKIIKLWKSLWYGILVLGATGYALFKYVDESLKSASTFSEKFQLEALHNRDVINLAAYALREGWPLLLKHARNANPSNEQSTSNASQLNSTLGDIHDANNLALLNPNFMQTMIHSFYFVAKIKDAPMGYRLNFKESKIDYYYPIVNMENYAISLLKITLVMNDELIKRNKAKPDQSFYSTQTLVNEVEEHLINNVVIDSVNILDPSPLIKEYGGDFFSSSIDPNKLQYAWDIEKDEFCLENARPDGTQPEPVLPLLTAGEIASPNMTPLMGYFMPYSLPKQILPK
ncbi:ATP-dependent helicase [Acrasis kona]|uniref:ATP-dependent helicase n=1 Tax=Acrasis kona TaxID=1008807 RepID=A0AAW2ZI70_9EUKA